jgi:hypothetical protein
MPINPTMVSYGFDGEISAAKPKAKKKKNDDDEDGEGSTSDSIRISIHTIQLPERAPKKLLLDLKGVLQTFPGSEKVQLKIGEQLIPLPLTIAMSPILEKKIDDLLEKSVAEAV